MPSIIDICNAALSEVGTRSTIASMTEASDEARNCSIHYDFARRAVLRVHTWAFAEKRLAAAMICAGAGTPENPTGTFPLPPYPWLYEYTWPVDCLRFRRIEMPPPSLLTSGATLSWTGNYPPLNNGFGCCGDRQGARRTPPYAISTDRDSAGNMIKVILTNQSQATFVYTMDSTDPNIWDADFEEAFIWALAARLCGPLTGDKNQARICAQNAEASVLKARVVDSNESPAKPEHTPDWIRARGPFGMESLEYSDLNLMGQLLG